MRLVNADDADDVDDELASAIAWAMDNIPQTYLAAGNSSVLSSSALRRLHEKDQRLYRMGWDELQHSGDGYVVAPGYDFRYASAFHALACSFKADLMVWQPAVEPALLGHSCVAGASQST